MRQAKATMEHPEGRKVWMVAQVSVTHNWSLQYFNLSSVSSSSPWQAFQDHFRNYLPHPLHRRLPSTFQAPHPAASGFISSAPAWSLKILVVYKVPDSRNPRLEFPKLARCSQTGSLAIAPSVSQISRSWFFLPYVSGPTSNGS